MDNKGESLTLEMVSKSLDNLCESLTERADLLPGPEKIIGSISVDFALFLGMRMAISMHVHCFPYFFPPYEAIYYL